jgi:hypothetical protein
MNTEEKIDVKYLCNPDVVLREEDEDGGLLFDPDTNGVKVLNTTGLFIWKEFNAPNTRSEVAQALLKNYEGATLEVVESDLQEFLAGMLENGFIGEVEQG